MESVFATFCPLLGSWCAHEARNETFGPAYSSFIPNALFQPGLVRNVAFWMMGRTRWFKENFGLSLRT